MGPEHTYTVFADHSLVVSGTLETVIPVLKSRFDEERPELLLIFEDQTGRQVDFDLRGTVRDALARAQPSMPRPGPGRPKLGVVSREVSLLPRHWDWLEQQSGGASAAIRRLVDEERKRVPDAYRVRAAREATGRFLTAVAGNLPGYEEATRALYSGNQERFREMTSAWPPDVRDHAGRVAQDAFPG